MTEIKNETTTIEDDILRELPSKIYELTASEQVRLNQILEEPDLDTVIDSKSYINSLRERISKNKSKNLQNEQLQLQVENMIEEKPLEISNLIKLKESKSSSWRKKNLMEF